ncbi:hypothetical protein Gotur_028077 [Gossypium turneri]
MDSILPVCGKKKKESNKESESLALLLNEELKASTMERINFENMHMSNVTASTSTAPNGVEERER